MRCAHEVMLKEDQRMRELRAAEKAAREGTATAKAA